MISQHYNLRGGKANNTSAYSSVVSSRAVPCQPSEKISLSLSTSAAMSQPPSTCISVKPTRIRIHQLREQFGEQSSGTRVCPSNKKQRTSANARIKRHPRTRKSCPTMASSSSASRRAPRGRLRVRLAAAPISAGPRRRRPR